MRVELVGFGGADDERDHDLTPLGVRCSDHSRFRYTRMFQQRLFHLSGIDVGAADDHDI